MGWLELTNEKPVKQEKKDYSVSLSATTRHYVHVKGPGIYFCRFIIGKELVGSLKWADKSQVKFIWGTGSNQGRIRIAPMRAGLGGWQFHLYKKGGGYIETRIFPTDVAKCNYNIKIDHILGIVQNSSSVERYLELTLPNTFFGNTILPDIEDKNKPVYREPTASRNIEELAPKQNKIHTSIIAPEVKSTVKKELSSKINGNSVDIMDVVDYLVKHTGELASVHDGRFINFNGGLISHNAAMSKVNKHRLEKGLPIWRFQII